MNRADQPATLEPSSAFQRSNRPRRVLIIAYHFPPMQGSTGTTRTLAFAKYLRQYGWDVTVLTVSPGAYPQIRLENNASIPAHVNVVRALTFDAQKHLSIAGRYPQLFAIPDRWRSWIITGQSAAMRLIRKQRPDVIYSTYPIASAHALASKLARRTGIPWVADFRDPMVQPAHPYPDEPRVYRAFEQIENEVFTHASRVITTTQSTTQIYRDRFPGYPQDRILTISNGYDPEMFSGRAAGSSSATSAQDRPLRLLHSGLLYPVERDPTQFFAAIDDLKRTGQLKPTEVQIMFRAPGNEVAYQKQLATADIEDLVKLEPPVPYQQALAEMQSADGLLLFQASNCNQQIPAKLYEYLYCCKPILGLTDPIGDTAALLGETGIDYIAPLDNKEAIKAQLLRFLEVVRAGTAYTPPLETVLKYSREALTSSLADVLESAAQQGAPSH
jgi:glycosyltransferase involved in cell wall biosynthesis